MRTGRLAVLIASLGALAASTSALAARGELAQSSCAAALVRYEWNRGAAGAPWVTVGPSKSRLEGWLYSYREYLEHARVNGSERLVLRAGREENKIGWSSRTWGGSLLTVTGRRLDGPGGFRQRFRAAVRGSWYPSDLRIPASGCWQLTLRTRGWERRLVAEAIEPAGETCDATPVPADGPIPLTPRRSRIVAGWGPWVTPEGGALLYTGGRAAEGGFTKVLWRTTRETGVPLGDMALLGTQLDGNGTFRQTLQEVGPGGPWPSHVVVPSAGCWLLTARIGGQAGAAGILVARVVEP